MEKFNSTCKRYNLPSKLCLVVKRVANWQCLGYGYVFLAMAFGCANSTTLTLFVINNVHL